MIEIDIAPLTVLFCNCPLLKDISFNTKSLLAWCDSQVITCLFRAIFGINHPHFTRAISIFSKILSGNLSQIALSSMGLLVLIAIFCETFTVINFMAKIFLIETLPKSRIINFWFTLYLHVLGWYKFKCTYKLVSA